jgi:hypothetical protein
VNFLILVVDDEPDVEFLFRQQFRRDLRAGRFAMDFAQSASIALAQKARLSRGGHLIEFASTQPVIAPRLAVDTSLMYLASTP